jgi:hypothetical protein
LLTADLFLPDRQHASRDLFDRLTEAKDGCCHGATGWPASSSADAAVLKDAASIASGPSIAIAAAADAGSDPIKP